MPSANKGKLKRKSEREKESELAEFPLHSPQKNKDPLREKYNMGSDTKRKERNTQKSNAEGKGGGWENRIEMGQAYGSCTLPMQTFCKNSDVQNGKYKSV